MPHFGSGVEYALHSLLYLADHEAPLSCKDLAVFQGIPPSYMAKLFTRLAKAGLVQAAEGVKGGYRLGRSLREITFLDVTDAIEGRKPLFECGEIRRNCILFDGKPPDWVSQGVCDIHAVMLAAESRMRERLAETTLADIVASVAKKIPPDILTETTTWFRQ